MEIIKKTLPVEEAIGWHLLQNEYKRWVEDFTDEDTGNVTPVERIEVILYKGCELTELDVSALKENGITSVYVSNVQLKGVKEEYGDLWEANLIVRISSAKSSKKRTYIVTASSPSAAEAFISEHLELNVECTFEAVKVSKADYQMVIKLYETEREEYEASGARRARWYKAQLFATVDGDSGGEESCAGDAKNILVQAAHFEAALKAIKAVMGRNEYDAIFSSFKSMQELNVEEVFRPEDRVSYYSNKEL